MLKIAFAPVYKYTLPEGHRFPMEKYELLPEQLLYEGTIQKNQFFHPACLTEETLLLTHTSDYWYKMQAQTFTPKEVRKIGFPMRPELIQRGLYIAQGTLECAFHALEFGLSMNIAGGTHHAYADRGEGFCIFNDIAIAANYLVTWNYCKKIVIIDLDVHQGNGTAHIFQDNPQVFTFSMHGAKNYPLRKEQSDLDIGLSDFTKDKTYLSILSEVLPPLLDAQKPSLVFYLSGVDIIEGDKLGRLAISLQGCKERDAIVFEHCYRRNIPVVASMGGGYSKQLARIIEAHANTFRTGQSIYF